MSKKTTSKIQKAKKSQLDPAESNKQTNIFTLVHRVNWPIDFQENPVLFEGREGVDRPFHMRLKEDLWLSIEHHCAALGVTKSEWVRVAILKLLQTEQQWFADQKASLRIWECH